MGSQLSALTRGTETRVHCLSRATLPECGCWGLGRLSLQQWTKKPFIVIRRSALEVKIFLTIKFNGFNCNLKAIKANTLKRNQNSYMQIILERKVRNR